MCACPSVSDCQSLVGSETALASAGNFSDALNQYNKRRVTLRDPRCPLMPSNLPTPLESSVEVDTAVRRSRESTPSKRNGLSKLELHPGDQAPKFLKRKIKSLNSSKICFRRSASVTFEQTSVSEISKSFSKENNINDLKAHKTLFKCSKTLDQPPETKQPPIPPKAESAHGQSDHQHIMRTLSIKGNLQYSPIKKLPPNPKCSNQSPQISKSTFKLDPSQLSRNLKEFAAVRKSLTSKTCKSSPLDIMKHSIPVSQYQTYMADKKISPAMRKPILARRAAALTSCGYSLDIQTAPPSRSTSCKKVTFDPFSVVISYKP